MCDCTLWRVWCRANSRKYGYMSPLVRKRVAVLAWALPLLLTLMVSCSVLKGNDTQEILSSTADRLDRFYSLKVSGVKDKFCLLF